MIPERVQLWILTPAQIVPGSNNDVAIDLICTHIRQKLQERSHKFRQKIAVPSKYISSPSGASTPEVRIEDLDLTILPQTRQLQVNPLLHYLSFSILTLLQGIFTILRDKTTSRQNFIFFTDRLSTLLVEHALQHLPYLPKNVITPIGVEARGKKLDAQVWIFDSACKTWGSSSWSTSVESLSCARTCMYTNRPLINLSIFQWRRSGARVPSCDKRCACWLVTHTVR